MLKKISGKKLQHIQNTINTTTYKEIAYDLTMAIENLYSVDEELILKYTTHKLKFSDNIIGIIPSGFVRDDGKITFFQILVLMTTFDDVISCAKTYTISMIDFLLYKQDLRSKKLNRILI